MITVDIISPGGAFSPAAVGNGVADDAPAFRAFNDWAQLQTDSITLTLGIGSKTFLFNTGDANGLRGNSPAYNVPVPLIIRGNGKTQTLIKEGSAGFFLGSQQSLKSGNGSFGTTFNWTARLNTASAGNNQVICKIVADAAQFTVNTWALMAGIDMQAGGDPINPFYFEYVFITGINLTTGIITFTAPLANTYLDSWPTFNAGSPGASTDQGGPATLYALDPSWNIDITYQSLGTQRTQQTYCVGRSVKFTDYQCFDNLGLTPTFAGAFTFTNCNLTSYDMEVDKVIGSLIFDSTLTGQLIFQSSSFNSTVIRNGCNIGELNGTPRFIEVHNSTVAGFFSLGTTAFGRTDTFVTTGSTFQTDITLGGVGDNGLLNYTMTNNVIKIPKAGLTYGDRWSIPGTVCYFTGNTGSPLFQSVQSPYFTIQSIIDDASFVYVTTNWPLNGFPFWANNINVVSSAAVNFSPDTISTGCPGITDLVAATAIGKFQPSQYTVQQFNGSNLGSFTGGGIFPPLTTGYLVSLTVDVVTPYTGTQSSLLWHLGGEFDNAAVIKADMNTAIYAPIFDLKTKGKRVITPAGVSGNSVTDSGLAIPTPTSWFAQYLQNVAANQDIRAEYAGNPSVGPVVNFTMITQGGQQLPPDATIFGGRWWQDYKKPAQTVSHTSEVKEAAAVLSKMGGHARAASLTAIQRSNIASIAAKARWK